MSKQHNRFNAISRGWNALFSIILGLAALVILIPMVLIVIISFSSQASIAARGYSFFPTEWSLMGYQALFQMGDQLLTSYAITLFITVAGTVMSLAVSTMYAYVLSLKGFNCHSFYTWILCFTMLFGGGMVPSYILNVRYLHLDDTIWIFLLPSLAGAYNIIMLRTFLTTTVPDSLIEAARISSSSSCVHSWFVCLMSPNSTSRQVFIESSRHPSQSKMIPLAFANFSNMHRLSCAPR